jgi:hypothetical protein
MQAASRIGRLLLTLSVLWGCSVDRQEIKRVRSPDERVEAVLIQTNAGATTAFSYEVFLVPTGATPKKGNELFRADQIINLELRWRQPKSLEIAYEQGRIFHFSNFWNSQDVDNFRHVVEVTLIPLKPSSLPALK